MLCKQNKKLSFHKLDTPSSRILPVAVTEASGSILQILMLGYLPYCDQASAEHTELFLEAVDAMQCIIELR